MRDGALARRVLPACRARLSLSSAAAAAAGAGTTALAASAGAGVPVHAAGTLVRGGAGACPRRAMNPPIPSPTTTAPTIANVSGRRASAAPYRRRSRTRLRQTLRLALDGLACGSRGSADLGRGSGTVVSPPKKAPSRSATARMTGRSRGRVLAQKLPDEVGQRRRDSRVQRPRVRRRLRHVRDDQVAQRRMRERRAGRHHFVQHAAERIKVGAKIQIGRIAALLGRHVERRPHQRPAARLVHLPGAKVAFQLRDAEVDDLHRFAGSGQDEHVLGLQVAVDDPGLVRRGQRVRNRARVSRGSRRRQRAPPRQRARPASRRPGTPSRCRGGRSDRSRSRTPGRCRRARSPTSRAPPGKIAPAGRGGRPARAPAA